MVKYNYMFVTAALIPPLLAAASILFIENAQSVTPHQCRADCFTARLNCNNDANRWAGPEVYRREMQKCDAEYKVCSERCR